MGRYLVLDIEAVRDWSVWQPPDDDLERFAPPFAWQPICIGFVLLDVDGAGARVFKVGAIEAPAAATTDEREGAILRKFASGFAREIPEVVTWNGRRFDIPVLMLRSMRYGLSCHWYYGNRDSRYRFTEGGHCDLADAMADYGSTASLGLDGMARLIGLPGKFGDIDGAKVGEAYAAGRLSEIVNYCISDAVQTAFLWLRWRLLKGNEWIGGADTYRAAARALLDACAADPRLAEFCRRIDKRVLLLDQESEAAA